jgi:translation initiation factor IF-3
VRLIDADGENRGVVPLARAQEIANAAALDLVEVAADARPPVCRIMDYGKWRYEQEQKAKQARRHQSTITIKEIKFRPKIDPHDYATKKGHVERFLRHRDKVKITIMFRGREMSHQELGLKILHKVAEDVGPLAKVEASPKVDGRNMIMVLAPDKRAQQAAASTAKVADPSRNGAESSTTAPPPSAPAATSAQEGPRHAEDEDRPRSGEADQGDGDGAAPPS